MNENKAKKTYVKPESEVIYMELEKPILSDSGNGYGLDFGGGGTWG